MLICHCACLPDPRLLYCIWSWCTDIPTLFQSCVTVLCDVGEVKRLPLIYQSCLDDNVFVGRPCTPADWAAGESRLLWCVFVEKWRDALWLQTWQQAAFLTFVNLKSYLFCFSTQNLYCGVEIVFLVLHNLSAFIVYIPWVMFTCWLFILIYLSHFISK